MSKPKMALIGGSIAILIVVCYWFFPGGGHGQNGDSDYQRTMDSVKEATDLITAQGGKVKDAPNPLGKKAYAVNLSGVTISDKLIEDLQYVSPIMDLDLSKSTITDDQLAQLIKAGLLSFVFKLNLSNTAISDASLDKLETMPVLNTMLLVGTKCTQTGVDKFKKTHASQKSSKFPTPTVKLN